MGMRTYFRAGDPRRVFVSIDTNERSRLKRRHWQKIYREEAIAMLGGQASFNFALAGCKTGEIEYRPHQSARCHGHGAANG